MQQVNKLVRKCALHKNLLTSNKLMDFDSLSHSNQSTDVKHIDLLQKQRTFRPRINFDRDLNENIERFRLNDGDGGVHLMELFY
uniref:Uncharacterized protein n=1 Tax=Romanomermis culicivorax TaxID=13658 RepID=A0A915J6L6_ROMCU